MNTAMATTTKPSSLSASPLSEDWWTLAACRQIDQASNLFFSEELPEIAAAKQVCAGCVAIAPCLEGALSRREPWGVWGGQLFLAGKVVFNKRRRGRPAKNPRPEDIVPDIAVPEHLQRMIA